MRSPKRMPAVAPEEKIATILTIARTPISILPEH
jgi:hypothetical protein